MIRKKSYNLAKIINIHLLLKLKSKCERFNLNQQYFTCSNENSKHSNVSTLGIQSNQRNTWHPFARELNTSCTTGELALNDELHCILNP